MFSDLIRLAQARSDDARWALIADMAAETTTKIQDISPRRILDTLKEIGETIRKRWKAFAIGAVSTVALVGWLRKNLRSRMYEARESLAAALLSTRRRCEELQVVEKLSTLRLSKKAWKHLAKVEFEKWPSVIETLANTGVVNKKAAAQAIECLKQFHPKEHIDSEAVVELFSQAERATKMLAYANLVFYIAVIAVLSSALFALLPPLIKKLKAEKQTTAYECYLLTEGLNAKSVVSKVVSFFKQRYRKPEEAAEAFSDFKKAAFIAVGIACVVALVYWYVKIKPEVGVSFVEYTKELFSEAVRKSGIGVGILVGILTLGIVFAYLTLKKK